MKTNVLLLRPDKAGDAVKSLPTIRAARKAFPNVQFSILCSQHNASLFAFEPGILIFQLPTGWDLLSNNELKKVVQALPLPTPVDKAVNLLCDVFPSVDFLLHLLESKEKYSKTLGLRLLHSTPAETPEEMNIAHLLGQALQTDLLSAITAESRTPVLCSSDREEAFNALGPKNHVRFALCPFAGTEQRSHSLRRWRHFVHLVTRSMPLARPMPRAKVYLIGSRNDQNNLAFLKGKNAELTILLPSSFRSLAAYLESMDGVIAIDSGPLHLAQAMGVASLGILSGGDFKRWYSKLEPRDKLITRGIFSRYPSLIEMLYAFQTWRPSSLHS